MDRKIYVLGSGNEIPPHPGLVRCDILPGKNVDRIFDLDVTPWPIPDGDGKFINASHVIEHLNNPIAFFDEAWRVLYPGGTMYVEVPNAENLDMSFCDPTHKRPYRLHSFINYFTVEGVFNFGYTKHAWELCFIQATKDIARARMMPINDVHLADRGLIAMNEVRRLGWEEEYNLFGEIKSY